MYARYLACLVAAFAHAAASAQPAEHFSMTLTTAYVDDYDTDDSLDLPAIYDDALWTIDFHVPSQDELTFLSNSQNQGGSFTWYEGVELRSVEFDGPGGSGSVIDAPIVGQMLLWDRDDFRGGHEAVHLRFDVPGGGDFDITFDAFTDDGHTAIGQMFNINTPDPNTRDDDFVPFFDTPKQAFILYSSVEFSINSAGPTPILGGLGLVGTEAVALGLSPEPCGVADFAVPFGTLDFFDVADFLAAFSAQLEPADIVHDGAFNFFDIAAFLDAFSNGCP